MRQIGRLTRVFLLFLVLGSALTFVQAQPSSLDAQARVEDWSLVRPMPVVTVQIRRVVGFLMLAKISKATAAEPALPALPCAITEFPKSKLPQNQVPDLMTLSVFFSLFRFSSKSSSLVCSGIRLYVSCNMNHNVSLRRYWRVLKLSNIAHRVFQPIGQC